MKTTNSSRFVIPFYFERQKYEELHEEIQKSGKIWRPWALDGEKSHLDSVFRCCVDPKHRNNIGSLWLREKDNKWMLKETKVVYHRPEKEKAAAKNASILCSVKDGGLAVFKTGIGFVWFELSFCVLPRFPEYGQETECTPEQLIEVTNFWKDICHLNPKRGGNRLMSFRLRKEAGEQTASDLGKENGKRVAAEIKAFSIYEWVCNSFLSSLNITPRFFVPRQMNSANGLGEGPDKAHIFASLFLSEKPTEEDKLAILYWLRKGYDISYLPAPGDLSPDCPDVLRTFENVTWSCCTQGCSVINYHTGNRKTDTFFESRWESSLRVNFLVYLICLHQFYLISRLTMEIAELPQDEKSFGNVKLETISSIRSQLDLAYTRAFFSRISYNDHYNALYDHIRHSLRIPELQRELSKKAELLSNMMEKHYLECRERRGRVLTVIGAVFAVIQSIATVLDIYQWTVWGKEWAHGRWVFTAAVVLLSVVLGGLVTLIWNKLAAKRDENE